MTRDQEETKARPSASGVEKMSPLVSLTLSETTPRPQDRRGSSWSWSRPWSYERVSRSSSSSSALRSTKAWISSSWIPQGRISICYQGKRSDWSELFHSFFMPSVCISWPWSFSDNTWSELIDAKTNISSNSSFSISTTGLQQELHSMFHR